MEILFSKEKDLFERSFWRRGLGIGRMSGGEDGLTDVCPFVLGDRVWGR